MNNAEREQARSAASTSQKLPVMIAPAVASKHRSLPLRK